MPVRGGGRGGQEARGNARGSRMYESRRTLTKFDRKPLADGQLVTRHRAVGTREASSVAPKSPGE